MVSFKKTMVVCCLIPVACGCVDDHFWLTFVVSWFLPFSPSPLFSFVSFALAEAPYTARHPVIRNLWTVVHSLTEEDKRKFLHFCTGSDRAPVRGLGSIPFVIGREPDSERLPSSHTCFNHLIVPEYATMEKLEAKLRAAIAQSEGFGLI